MQVDPVTGVQPQQQQQQNKGTPAQIRTSSGTRVVPDEGTPVVMPASQISSNRAKAAGISFTRQAAVARKTDGGLVMPSSCAISDRVRTSGLRFGPVAEGPGASEATRHVHPVGLRDLPAPQWISGTRCSMLLEIPNGWHENVEVPALQIHKRVEQRGERPFIVTEYARRAASPGRTAVISQEIQELDRADGLLDRLMLEQPLQIPQLVSLMTEANVEAPRMNLASLIERFMEIEVHTPGILLVMANTGYRHLKAQHQERRTVKRDVLVFERSGDFLRTEEIREIDLGLGPNNPVLFSKVMQARYERVPRDFVDFFDGKYPQGMDADTWNAARQHDAEEHVDTGYLTASPASPEGSPRGGSPKLRTIKYSRDNVGRDFPDEFDSEASSGNQAPSSSASSDDEQPVAPSEASDVTVDDEIIRADLPAVGAAPSTSRLLQLAAASQDTGLVVVGNRVVLPTMDIYTPAQGELIGVTSGDFPQIMRMKLDDQGQVKVKVVRVISWYEEDDETVRDETVSLESLAHQTQQMLSGAMNLGEKPFDRAWLVGPNPEMLKQSLFAVMDRHPSNKAGKCLVLDNGMHLFDAHERQFLRLSDDRQRINIKVHNRAKVTSEQLEQGVTVFQRFSMRTALFHPVIVDLVDGKGVAEWNDAVIEERDAFERRLDSGGGSFIDEKASSEDGAESGSRSLASPSE